MRAVEVIERKRFAGELSADEIAYLVDGFTSGAVADYQMSAFVMAVACQGMAEYETVALTDAMLASGTTLDLSGVPGIKVDKHSTGGVGDKTTLAVVPLLAAAGVPVAKMSGRGLGHTGGTLDKLESIPGYRISLTEVEIVDQVQRVGACIVAQTDNIVPADKKMYALRDVTGSVSSFPLIASSIMSKKLACGADAIVLDVKCGRGALIAKRAEAAELARLLVRIGKARGRRMYAVLTDMDMPLGRAVGNWLEVREVIDLLKARPADARLLDAVLHLTRLGLEAGGKNPGDAEQLLESGRGYAKFAEIVKAQGGDIAAFDRAEAQPAEHVTATNDGYVADIDALVIGKAAMRLGAGRERKDDIIDPSAGILLLVSAGDFVREGEQLAALYGNSVLAAREKAAIMSAFTLSSTPIAPAPLLHQIISEPIP